MELRDFPLKNTRDTTDTFPFWQADGTYKAMKAETLLGGFVGDDDPRLSDAREPLAHTQEINSINGLQAILNSLGNATALKYAIIQDQKANGSDGGTAVGGSWTTRTLNTIVSDPNGILSLSGNAFSLGAGTYVIQALASLWSDSNVQQSARARIFNVTDGATALLGPNSRGHSASGSSLQFFSPVNGPIVLASTKTFRLEQYFQNTFNVSRALGLAGSFGVIEVYSEVQVWKIA